MWWWTYLRQWKSRSILPKRALFTLKSDASDLGWGAVYLNQKTSTGGVWNTRDDPPHQLQGTSCSLAGAPMLCFNPTGCTHTSSDRQHSISGLYEQNGRSAFQEPVSTSITGLGSVPPQEPYDFSRAPSRLTEPTGRQRVENRLGFFRMGTVHPDLPQTDGDEGPMYCGCLCIPSFSQTSNILQLEIGPRSKSSGCSNTVVEQHQRLCLPSILPNRQVSSQNQIREGTLGTVDHKLGFLYSQRCWCNLRSYFRATTC